MGQSAMRKLILLTSSLSLAACAHYAPAPISDPGSSALLQPPVAAVLSRQASSIDRPYLAPVVIDLSAPLHPNEIAIIAVLSNPDLKAMRARAGINDAQVFAAGLLPDPSFSFGIDHILSGPDPVDNIAGALGFSLNALRTRSVLREQAKQQALQVRLDLAWAEWQTASNARLQAVRILELRRALDIATTSEQSAGLLLSRYLRASGRGDIRADQVQSARLSALDALSNRQTTQTNLSAAEYELRKLLGLPPEYALSLAAQPAPAASPGSAALFSLAVANRTDLQALKAGYDAQEASVRKAVLDQFPSLDLTLSGARDTGTNKLLGPSLGFTLPLWNRNRGGIAVEQATRAALRAEYDARLFQTRADIAAAVGSLDIARQQRADIMDSLPEIEEFARATRRAANRGDLALATAETAEQSVRDKQFLLVQIEQAIAEQTIALELLVGAPQAAWE
jgi:cobalt-zinc-cadmium efflux system outer membrane protein